MYLAANAGVGVRFDPETFRALAGDSVDAIFVAPPYQTDPLGYNRYLFYNRNYRNLNNGGHSGYGGQMTEVRVFPSATLPIRPSPTPRVSCEMR